MAKKNEKKSLGQRFVEWGRKRYAKYNKEELTKNQNRKTTTVKTDKETTKGIRSSYQNVTNPKIPTKTVAKTKAQQNTTKDTVKGIRTGYQDVKSGTVRSSAITKNQNRTKAGDAKNVKNSYNDVKNATVRKTKLPKRQVTNKNSNAKTVQSSYNDVMSGNTRPITKKPETQSKNKKPGVKEIQSGYQNVMNGTVRQTTKKPGMQNKPAVNNQLQDTYNNVLSGKQRKNAPVPDEYNTKLKQLGDSVYAISSNATGGTLGGSRRKTETKKYKPTTSDEPYTVPIDPQQIIKNNVLKHVNSPYSAFDQNSSSWAALQAAKETAARMGKTDDVARYTKKQNELHQWNEELAKNYNLRYDADSGTWVDKKTGKAAYEPGLTVEKTRAMNRVTSPLSATETAKAKREAKKKGLDASTNPALNAAISTLPSEKEMQRSRAKDYEKLKEQRRETVENLPQNARDLGATLGRSAWGGLNEFSANAYSTADKFIPDDIPLVSKAIKYGYKNARETADAIKEKNYAQGNGYGLVGDFASGTASALPNVIMALMSGGTSAGAQLGANGSRILPALQALWKNPGTWATAMQIYGPEYDRAVANGANPVQAASTALMSTLAQTTIGMTGGVETMNIADGLRGMLRTSGREAMENIAQDLASGLINKSIYDYDRPVFGTGQTAIVNPERLATGAAMGAVTGAAMKGGSALTNRALQGMANAMENPAVRSRLEALGIVKPDVSNPYTEESNLVNKFDRTAERRLFGSEKPRNNGTYLGNDATVQQASTILDDPQSLAYIRAQGAKMGIDITGTRSEQIGQIQMILAADKSVGASDAVNVNGITRNPMNSQYQGIAVNQYTPEHMTRTVPQNQMNVPNTGVNETALDTNGYNRPYVQETVNGTVGEKSQTRTVNAPEPITSAQVREIANNPQEIARLNQIGANIHGSKAQQRAQINAFLAGQRAEQQAEVLNTFAADGVSQNSLTQNAGGNQAGAFRDNRSIYRRVSQRNSAEGTPEQNLELLQGMKAKIQNDLQTADSSRAAMLRSSLREINAEISQLQETVKNRRVFGAALYDTPITQSTRPNDNIAPALAAAGSRLPTNQTVQGVGNAYMNPLVQQYQNNLTGNTAQNAVLNAGGKLSNWDTAPRAQDTPTETPVIASKSRQFENQPIVQENPIQSIQNPTVQRAVRETIPENNPIAETVQNPVSPDSSVGAAKSGFDPYTKAANEYGTIEPGERRARDVDVPKQMNDDTSVNRFARTVMEAEVTPDEMIGYLQDAVANGMFNGINRKNKSEVQSAMRYLEQNGIEAGLAAWNQKMASNGKVTTDDVVRAMLIMQRAAKDGDYQTATKLAAEISVEMRAAGQMTQSARILKMYGNTPEADVMSLQRAIQKINDDFSSQFQKQRYKEEKKAQRKGQTFDDTKFDGLKLSDEQMRRIMEATDENERQKIVEQVGAELADQLPVGLWDKWNSWRFFCMLQKPATHVRNIFGNVLNYAINVKPKNAIGAVMELSLPKEQRTKSIGPVGKEISDFVKQDFDKMEGVIRGDVKYDLGQSILSQRPAFGNSNNIIIKGLNHASEFVGDSLETQDSWALGWNYRDALGHYMKARGLKVSDMTGDTLEAARTYAIKEAQEATFRDPSQLATELSRIERNHLLGKVFIGSQMPFKKTPINIAKRGIEYSPAGVVKAASDAAKLVQQKRSGLVDGSIQASDIINDIAKATTGSALMGVGFLLAGKGFLTGADAENRKEDMLNSAMGEQSYALKVGDYTYTLDWAAPAVMPLFAGVELYNVTHKKYGDDTKVTDAVLHALCNLTAPLFEMSCMQGISNDIQTIAYGGGSDGEKAMAVAWNTFADYIGQGVPNILPGLQKTFDDTKRSSSSPDQITGLTNVDKFLRRQQAKIPWVAENGIPGTRVTGLQPYQDVFGRETTDDNIVRRALQNIVSPGYLKKITGGAVENELKDLYGRTQNTTVLPGKAGAFRVEGEDIKLTGKEQTEYTKAAGQGAYKTLESLFSTDTYKNMSDEDKVRAISDVYEYAKSVAKAGTNKGYNMSSTDKLAQQAAADGAPIGSYFALKALQAAQEAKLKDEGTEGAESLARRAMLNAVQNDTSLSDDQKNALYKDLVIPAYGSTTKGVNSASKEYEELSNYISPAVYAALKDKKNEIDTDPKYVNDDGSNVKGSDGLKQGDWEKYLANAGLTPAARAAVQDKVKFWQQIPATAKATNFSDAATYGMGSKTAQKYAAQAERAGLSWDTYQDVAQYKNSLKGTGDGQKDKVISYINKITSDPAQRAVLRKLMNYK